MRFAARVACAAVVLCLALAPGALAETGFCIQEGGLGSVWEINVVTCSSSGTQCLLQLSRPKLPTIPLPSLGALSAGTTWNFTWQAAFAGATQGTVGYACEVEPTGGLPWTGDGMALRHANFNGATEIFTGTCSLDHCSSIQPSPGINDGVWEGRAPADKTTQP